MNRLVLALAIVISPMTLAAHMALEKSFPADRSIVTSAPRQIQLWFSAAPVLAVSHIGVTGPSGKVALGTLALGKSGDTPDNSMMADIKGSLAPGKYVVSWRTSGSDGHMLNGSLEFTLKTP